MVWSPLRVGNVIVGVLVISLLAAPTTSLAQMGHRRAAPSLRPGNAAQSKTQRPSPYFAPKSGLPVKEIKIRGNRRVAESKVRALLSMRVDRTFDPHLVQADVRTLITSGLFRDVRTFTEPTQNGIIVIYEVFERPTIGHIRFVGNRVRERHLLRESGLKEGEALNIYGVQEGRRRLEEYYRKRGNTDVAVTIAEGDKPGDIGVTYQIDEGVKKRIWKTAFVGNTIASDARLKTQIQSKPGILWLFKGKVDNQAVEEDLERLTSYYRSLGFFQAKVAHEMNYDEDGKWLTLTFHIDEGPRYRVREIRTVGNERFSSDRLISELQMKAGEHFNLAKLRRDEATLNDVYGSQGFIAAKIVAEPQFQEDPGLLDMVYKIEEGDQYRVGRIFVNIEGDHAHTRRSVVLNRLSIRTGDIVDIREIRNSERRLKASQLFLTDPSQGVAPSIAVRPSESSVDAAIIADMRSPRSVSQRPAYRGQSPQRVDVFISGKLKEN